MHQSAPDSWPVELASFPSVRLWMLLSIYQFDTSTSWTIGSGDNAKTMLVDLLEEEWGIIYSEILAIYSRYGRGLKIGQVINIAVNGNGHTRNTVPRAGDTMKPCSECPMQASAKPTPAVGEDKTKKAHILSPCTLLLWTAKI